MKHFELHQGIEICFILYTYIFDFNKEFMNCVCNRIVYHSRGLY